MRKTLRNQNQQDGTAVKSFPCLYKGMEQSGIVLWFDDGDRDEEVYTKTMSVPNAKVTGSDPYAQFLDQAMQKTWNTTETWAWIIRM